MKLKNELIYREVAGEHVLVPLGVLAQEYPGLFSMNELAVFLWKHIPQADDEQHLVNMVLEEYDVSEAEAKEDVLEYLKDLKELGVLE